MNHTKEPWFYSKSKHGIDGGHDVIACIDNNSDDMSLLIHAEGDEFNPDANARRIVACVNACAEIPTDDLEIAPEKGLFHLAEFATATVIERDTYRELCAELLTHLKNSYRSQSAARDFLLESSITKAEAILGEKNGDSN